MSSVPVLFVIAKRAGNPENPYCFRPLHSDAVRRKIDQGEVLAVGPGKRDDGEKLILWTLRSAIVLFGKYSADR